MSRQITSDELNATIDRILGMGGPFEVVDKTVDGVTFKSFAGLPPSLREFFMTSLQYKDDDFIVYGDERYSFGDVWGIASKVAHGLREKTGLKKGDRVAIAMRNYPEFIFAFMGVILAGGVAVPLNAWWESAELAYGMEDCGAKLVIADPVRLARMKQWLLKTGVSAYVVRAEDIMEGVCPTFDEIWKDVEASTPPAIDLGHEDDATIMYTSGSTGYPKGVVSTHAAVLATVMNWGVYLMAIKGTMEAKGIDMPHQPASLLTIPLFHVTCSHSLFLMSLPSGRKLVIMDKWDVDEAYRLIEKEKITGFTGVPTMSHELVHGKNRTKYDLSSLIDISAGGAARPADHVAEMVEAFPNSAPGIGYGLTETNAIGTLNNREDYITHPTSAGRPVRPMAEIEIRDDDGHAVPVGEVGEICIKSLANFKAYWNRPEDTAEVLKDGWFQTGDLGRIDEDGFVYIVDRKKDIIIRGGENISCLEVEDAIYMHPAIAEASVFALPDDRLGEIVAAAYYKKPGHKIDSSDLSRFLHGHLASFKIPVKFFVHDEPLPKLGSAKIDRKGLRDHYRTHV